MRDDRQSKRPFAWWPKQYRVSSNLRIGRRHKPGLGPIGYCFRALRAERVLRDRGGRQHKCQQDCDKKRPDQKHRGPIKTGRPDRFPDLLTPNQIVRPIP